MIKFGIFDAAQLKTNESIKGLFGGEKRISITLYEDAVRDPALSPWAEKILKFFADERGVYKRTYSNRFEVFDDLVVNAFKSTFDSSQDLIIHDVGVADARSSCDLFKKLDPLFHKLAFFASDPDTEITIFQHNRIRVSQSKQGALLEVVWPPFVFNQGKSDLFWHYPVNALLNIFLRKLVLPSILEKGRTGKTPSKSVTLFCPEALKLAASHPHFKLLAYDMNETLASLPFVQADAVRIMNVLNQDYFSDEDIQKYGRRLLSTLKENGLFVIGSNGEPGSLVHGGIYVKKGEKLSPLVRSGDGAVIEKLGFLI